MVATQAWTWTPTDLGTTWYANLPTASDFHSPGGSSLLTGLAAYYAFETLTTDSGGSGITLTNTGPVTQSSSGLIGKCASFSGGAQYLSSTSTLFRGSGANGFTAAGWMNLTSVAASHTLIGKIAVAESAAAIEYEMHWDAGNGRFEAEGGNGATSIVILATDTGAASINTWYFLCMWYDPIGAKLHFSVNNGTDNNGSLSSIQAGSAKFQIGAYSDNGDITMKGLIDEVGFWNRVLTSAERTSLYNGGLGRTYPFIGG